MARTPAPSIGDKGPSLKMVTIEPGDLKAALAGASATTAGVKIYTMPVDRLRPAAGFNIRVTDSEKHREAVARLATSIATEGFYNTKPLAGFVGKDGAEDVIFIVDGHTRLEAIRMINSQEESTKIETVPVVLKPKDTDPVEMTVALHKENSGEPLTAAEFAVIVKRLLNHGLTEDQIATRLDVTKRYVQDMVVLIGSPKSVREAVKHDKISGTMAIKILRKHSAANDKGAAAAAVIKDMLDKAEKTGRTKATAMDSPEGTKAGKTVEKVTDAAGRETVIKVKPIVTATKWTATKGERVSVRDPSFRFFGKLAPDTDWYVVEKDGFVTATENIAFELKITRPKKEAVAEGKPAPDKKKINGTAAPGEPAQSELEVTSDTEGLSDPTGDDLAGMDESNAEVIPPAKDPDHTDASEL
jgi:ParB family chromosome partitioning protein